MTHTPFDESQAHGVVAENALPGLGLHDVARQRVASPQLQKLLRLREEAAHEVRVRDVEWVRADVLLCLLVLLLRMLLLAFAAGRVPVVL